MHFIDLKLPLNNNMIDSSWFSFLLICSPIDVFSLEMTLKGFYFNFENDGKAHSERLNINAKVLLSENEFKLLATFVM